MAANYDSVLDAMRGYGLDVAQINVGPNGAGKPWRCREIGGDREKRGWYLVHEIRADDGEYYLIGTYGIYHGTDPGTQRISLAKQVPVSTEAREAMRARMVEDRKRAKAAREAEARRAATRAARTWRKALTTPPRPIEYLEAKGVQAYGLRYTESGALVIPMQDAKGQIHGLQFILPAGHPHLAKTGRGKTYWPAGLAVTGHFHLIGNPAAASVCLVAEGYATAATLHEATGLPVAVAFSANNLQPVAMALHRAWPRVNLLICADDDYLTDGNPGQAAADAAALAVGGAWVAPVFPSDRGGEKLTDFNDLQHFPDGGLHLVSQQVRDRLHALGWDQRGGVGAVQRGGGENNGLKPLLTIDEACERYSLIYGGKATLFDHWEHCLVPKSDVLDVLPDHGWRLWKERPDRKLVRMREVGFDPGGQDPDIKCNLFGGWPTEPKAGECQELLDLLGYLCSAEPNAQQVYDWVLKWLAYPIQHPGAKMKTALVFHGPQGVGKNLFFESVMAIYGEYGRIIDQAAVEDKFNDWASRKLFMVCDEVVARQELFHLKNKLKALVTGDSIRINPKNVTPHDEQNHVNLVFLSNERQPLVLERDDRRYAVVWVPEMLPQRFYDVIGAEIAAGGVAALHHYLKTLDLGDFKPWTRPPATRARQELIDVSLESTERFLGEWQAGELEWPVCACASMDLYTAYQRWARSNGVARPRESNHVIAQINKMRGWVARSVHVYESAHGMSKTRTQKMVLPPDDVLALHGAERGPDERMVDWATKSFFRFREAIHGEQF